MIGLDPSELIECAAILHDDVVYKVPRPGRHHDVCRLMSEQYNLGPDAMGVQGFVTTSGRFVGRKEARIIAEFTGQILPKTKQKYTLSELYSEDVW